MQKEFNPFSHYAQTKLAGMMALRELDLRLRQRGSQVPVNAVHPGDILTDIHRDLHWTIGHLVNIFRPVVLTFLKDAPNGCIGTLYASTAPALATANDATGEHLMRLVPIAPSEAWLDKATNQKLWERSLTLTGAPDV